MTNIQSISIIGLGFMGGSIAKAAKEKAGIKNILAFSKDAKDIELALSEKVINKGFTDLDKELFESDIVFLCTPVKAAAKILEEMKASVNSNAIITDIGSTKSHIDKVAKELSIKNFIGGHPMAGSEKTGYRNSIAHLFENAFYILTKNEFANEEQMKKMVSFISSIDAIPIVLDANSHDHITAVISHLPHIAATTLVSLAKKYQNEERTIEDLAAGGFKGLTRIASSSPVMWENICLLNQNHIKIVLDAYIDELKKFKSLLTETESKNLRKYFEHAKQFRDGIKEKRSSTQDTYYDIWVDIEDKPGSIASVATLLSENMINIKNINVPANREDIGGALLVSFDSEQSRVHALSILNKKNIQARKII